MTVATKVSRQSLLVGSLLAVMRESFPNLGRHGKSRQMLEADAGGTAARTSESLTPERQNASVAPKAFRLRR